MIQVEILEHYIEELDDNSFSKLRDWFIEFDQTRWNKKAEKKQNTAAIWQDLAENNENFQTPVWHETELKKTGAEFLAGNLETIDWQQAKKQLRVQFE